MYKSIQWLRDKRLKRSGKNVLLFYVNVYECKPSERIKYLKKEKKREWKNCCNSKSKVDVVTIFYV